MSPIEEASASRDQRLADTGEALAKWWAHDDTDVDRGEIRRRWPYLACLLDETVVVTDP